MHYMLFVWMIKLAIKNYSSKAQKLVKLRLILYSYQHSSLARIK